MSEDLKIASEISSNLQNVKSNSQTTPINISKDKVQIDGDLECTGEALIKLPSDLTIPNLTSNTITCPDIQATDIDFVDSGTNQKITRISDNQIDVDTQILVIDNTAEAGQARLEVFSTTGEDTFIVFREGVGSQNYIGTDAGDDKLKLGRGTTVGSETYLELNTTENVSNNPIKLVEQASAVADTAGQGQLWVKNDTPNNIYFTNDAGNDVQITNGASLAGGSSGLNPIIASMIFG